MNNPPQDIHRKIWNILVMGPLVLSPLLAVEFPRILAYLPLIPTIAGGIVLLLLRRKLSVPVKPLGLLFVFLCLLAANSFFVAVYPEAALDRFKDIVPLVCIGFLFLLIIQAGADLTSYQSKIALMVSCTAAALLICFEMLTQASVYQMLRPQAQDDIFSMAVFNRGALVTVFLSMMVFFMTPHKKQYGIIVMMAALFCMAALVESQAAQVSIVVGLVVFYLFPASKKWAWQGVSLIACMGIVFAPFIVRELYALLPESAHDIDFLRNAYVGNRLEIWDAIAVHIGNNPVWGHGLEFTSMEENLGLQGHYLKQSSVLHPHNAVLQIWVELGAIGILLCLIAKGLLFQALYRSEDMLFKKAALASFVMVAVTACFTYGIWQAWWIGLFFIITAFYIVFKKCPQIA